MRIVGGIISTAAVALAASLGVCVPCTAGDDCAGVYRASALAEWVEAAKAERADVVGIGDSNQLYGGIGWDEGWLKALSDRFGLYATGLVSAGENGGLGSNMGYLYNGFSTFSSGQFVYSGAPAALDDILSPNVSMFPLNYLYLPSGSAGGLVGNGIFMAASCPINVNAALRFHIIQGTFAGDGNGWFQPSIRLEQPPYSVQINGSVVSSMAETVSVSRTMLDLPAGPRNAALGFRFCPRGVDLAGPFLAYYSRVENLERPKGASFSTLYASGGKSARQMAFGLISASDAYLSRFFGEVRLLQGARKSVLVRINTGLNDRNEALPSLGPAGVTDGDSPEAFADNITAICDRIRQIWTINSWDPSELYFLVSVSHPIDTPDDVEMASYREAAQGVADAFPRTAVTRFDRLTSSTEMIGSGWYQSAAFDRAHLTQSGFYELSRRELLAIIPICRGDADASGAVNFADVTFALSNYGACVPLPGMGDADGNHTVNFADITEILANYGVPCP